jgi:hypothetical protein
MNPVSYAILKKSGRDGCTFFMGAPGSLRPEKVTPPETTVCPRVAVFLIQEVTLFFGLRWPAAFSPSISGSVKVLFSFLSFGRCPQVFPYETNQMKVFAFP